MNYHRLVDKVADGDIDISDLIEEGYDAKEINDILGDAGFDEEHIREAWVDVGYDWKDALLDSIRDNAISEEEFKENVHDYADSLDMYVSDLYDIYFGYEDD